MYRELKIGELFALGDEMRDPLTGTWRPVPKQWIAGRYRFEMVGTVKYCRIKMRRPIYHIKESASENM